MQFILVLLYFSILSQIKADEFNLNEFHSEQIFVDSQIRNDNLPNLNSIKSFGKGRIFNGQDVANIENFGYQAGIMSYDMKNQSSWCGGAILSNTWIITAAHCLINKTRSKIYLGYLDLRKANSETKTIPVPSSNYIIHKNYNQITKLNDIALVKLTKRIKFSSTIYPINLFGSSDNTENRFDGDFAIISGWGAKSNNIKDLPYVLQYARVKIMDEEICQRYFKLKITMKQICQSGDERKGICKGDSGGPLVASVNGETVLVGISSFISSFGCESPTPRVFTRISQYLNWIYDNINE